MPIRLDLSDEQLAELTVEQRAHLESIALAMNQVVRPPEPAPPLHTGVPVKVVEWDDGTANEKRYAERVQGDRLSDPNLIQEPERYDR